MRFLCLKQNLPNGNLYHPHNKSPFIDILRLALYNKMKMNMIRVRPARDGRFSIAWGRRPDEPIVAV